MTPEGKVKAFIDQRMKIWFPDAIKYSPPGGRFGKAGFPDRLWFIRANDKTCVVVAIEAKAPNCEATQMQLHTLVKLKEQGVISAIVVGRDEEYMNRVHAEIQNRIRKANEEV
jgi:hypothetical protein